MLDFSETKNLLKSCATSSDYYQKIIELGKKLSPMPEALKMPEKRVQGCQSTVFLHSEFLEKKIYFTASSDALISAGLVFLLLFAYNGQTPETVLTCKPLFLEELPISSSLSPGRANGAASVYLHMQKEALKYLTSF